MTQPALTLDVDSFLTLLRNRTANGRYDVMLDGGVLPVSVLLQDSPCLVFTFTGAANRDEGNTLPQFASTGLYKYMPASFIRLADPSLDRNDEMRLAWYAGHDGFALQQQLPNLIMRMIEHLGVTRAAFVGGSGGGFAALYYSWHIPQSVAIVLNPQTNLNKYHWGHRRRYREVCWPSLDAKAPLDSVVDVNLCPLYAGRFDNTVICIQIASDYFHLTRQFAPFVAALPAEHRERLIVRVANWGVKGHKPAPTAIWIPWIVAALSAPDTTAESIEATWAEQNPFELPPLKRLPGYTRPSAAIDAAVEKILAEQAASPQAAPKPIPPATSRDEQIARELAGLAFGTLLGEPSSGEQAP